MALKPTLTTPPTPPSLEDSAAVFRTRASAFVDWQVEHAGEMQEAVDYIEAASDAVETQAQEVADTVAAVGDLGAAVTAAAGSAEAAAGSATTAGEAATAAGEERALAQTAAANAQSSSRACALWTTLQGFTGTVNGEGATVLDTDTGTHSAASATGYDGATVDNAGRYSWNATWSRWVRIGDNATVSLDDAALTGSSTAEDFAVSGNLTVDQYNISWRAKRDAYLQTARESRVSLPKAAVVLLVGQSLNAGRGGSIVKTSCSVNALMLNGGAHVSAMDFWPTNVQHCMDWNETTSAVTLAEGGEGQSPCVGIASTLLGGRFEKVYICSVAVGARSVATLSAGGPLANADAAFTRLVALAVADGYDPECFVYWAHGEADAAASTAESTYVTRAVSLLTTYQMFARRAMGKPHAAVPVAITYPAEHQYGDDETAIKDALRSVAKRVPDCIDLGSIYQWPMETDLVHPTPAGYVMRGEMVGRAFRDGAQRALEITDATWDGATTAVITFNQPITRDATLGKGSALNGVDGFRWFDNGTEVTISGVAFSGWQATLTLSTTPIGTTAQQVITIACQDNTPNGTVPANISGSNVRAAVDGWVSLYDPTYTNYPYASPGSFEVRDA
ncbi:hypothetical protein [Sagittula sp. S175]|uniref:hypothetical protein n=1 Tax=Sagittula sp. S175 TaxID=3415129 RepID=UPI003C79A061